MMAERDMRGCAWRTIGWQQYALVNSTGRIIGRVDGGDRCHHASCETRPLGEYVDRDSAKRAVEDAVLPFAPGDFPARPAATPEAGG